jgi:hypothetical protein
VKIFLHQMMITLLKVKLVEMKTHRQTMEQIYLTLMLVTLVQKINLQQKAKMNLLITGLTLQLLKEMTHLLLLMMLGVVQMLQRQKKAEGKMPQLIMERICQIQMLVEKMRLQQKVINLHRNSNLLKKVVKKELLLPKGKKVKPHQKKVENNLPQKEKELVKLIQWMLQ